MPLPLLRLATAADGDAIAAIYAPYVEGTSISFEETPPGGDEIRRRMTSATVRVPWLVAERGGEVAGYAYAGEFRARAAYRWSLESSVYVAEAHHRAGVARGLMGAVIDMARGMGFGVMVAGATTPNDPSAALHEALGFTAVGEFPAVGRKRGAWHGVGFWTLDLGVDSMAQNDATSGDPEEPRTSLSESERAEIFARHASTIRP